MSIFSETGSENEFPLAATPADKKLLKNNRHTLFFPNTGSENEFPLAATPADKKLLEYLNRWFANISTIRYIPLDGLLISQQSDIFRYSDLLISQQSDIFR